jgi:hypothetical protein
MADLIRIRAMNLRFIKVPRLKHCELDPMRVVHFDGIHVVRFLQAATHFKRASGHGLPWRISFNGLSPSEVSPQTAFSAKSASA